ncbi:probable cytochrome P450 4ac1 [Drosophila sulfurigaster albostrigata]|uniref:probable cytochrome P450 4ac1 n=1 Tax=Drosophila sulfurigaster albostrigata TaxID=89887 RepID=UPI002D21EB76|nr:probable cytochrome P450 4ac1 [Drosophila sulfurigaster albostrigata]
MLTILFLSAILLLSVWILLEKLKSRYFILSLAKRVQTEDGSPLEEKVFVVPGKTRFGNNLDVLQMTPSMLFKFMRNAHSKSNGKSYLFYFLLCAMYNAVRAEDVEEIMQSTKLITKNVIYDLLRPFLGEGLLISTDQTWHFRRKLLTPAFHFNVLQNFLDIFKEESQKLRKVLQKQMNIELELKQIIPQFTLNNICETALGVKLDDMVEGAQYRKSIHAIEEVIVERLCNPLLYLKPYYYLFGSYRKHVTNLQIAHAFSSRIIERKREQFKQQQSTSVDEYGRKKRYAMLDTLLAAEDDGLIDHQGICDEVNTFMLEGYDTTSTCLTFTLLMLALHEDVQERCFEELQHLSNDDSDLTVFDYNNLTYMECVIKESLRLFPSVPFFGRICTEECVVNGLILPKGTQINIHAFDIMRDPRHFPNPSEFQPDRFLPHNTLNRHPFAFIPFSAGQRNCIGQKFAILEIKVMLVSILRNFKLLPVTRLEDVLFEYGLVLRTQNSVKLMVTSRQQQKSRTL